MQSWTLESVKGFESQSRFKKQLKQVNLGNVKAEIAVEEMQNVCLFTDQDLLNGRSEARIEKWVKMIFSIALT